LGRFFPARFFSGWFVVARFLIAARLFPTGFSTTGIRATFRFAFTRRRLDAAQSAAEGLNLALIVKFLAFSQFNQFLDFFHLVQRLFERLNDAAHVVRSLGDGGIGIVTLRFRRRRTMDRLPLDRLPLDGRGFHRRRGGSRRFHGGSFRGIFRRLWRGRWLFRRRRRPGSGWLAWAASTTAATSASAM
jgi:hypothetical protein